MHILGHLTNRESLSLRRNIVYLVILFLTLLLWLSDIFLTNHVVGNEIYSENSYTTKNNVLKVGIIKNSLNYYKTLNNDAGFEYDLSLAFANYLGKKLEVVLYSNQDEIFKDLRNNKIDIATGNLLFDNQKINDFAIGPAYQQANLQLIYNKSFKAPLSMNDHSISIAINSDVKSILKEYEKSNYTNLNLVNYHKSSENLIIDVANKNVKYTIANSLLVNKVKHLYPQIKVAFDITLEISTHWYLSTKNYFLQKKLFNFITEANENRTIERLMEQYIPRQNLFDAFDLEAFIMAMKKDLPKYEQLFKTHQGDLDWRILAAISYQESHWNPLAVSPTGVKGLMMLTQDTANFMNVRNRVDIEDSIIGGSKYLHFLLKNISPKVHKDSRIWYALVAYNMGIGHLNDAMALTELLGKNPYYWKDLKETLPLLNSEKYYKRMKLGFANGIQAYHYVDNISRYVAILNHYKPHYEVNGKNDIEVITKNDSQNENKVN